MGPSNDVVIDMANALEMIIRHTDGTELWHFRRDMKLIESRAKEALIGYKKASIEGKGAGPGVWAETEKWREAYYEICEAIGTSAMAISPQEAHATIVMPKIRGLVRKSSPYLLYCDKHRDCFLGPGHEGDCVFLDG